MIPIVKHSIRFFLFILAQALIFNQLELAWGIQFMIYPLFILLLPWDMNNFATMAVAFLMGISIDSISNTFGLHASSAVLIAYLRPYLLKMLESRDGYELGQEFSYQNSDFSWILTYQGLLLLIHHFWFFLIEIFKFNETLYIFQKTLLSVPVSFLICILIQIIFIKKQKV